MTIFLDLDYTRVIKASRESLKPVRGRIMAVEFNATFGYAAIVVKFMGPTNYKPSRYKATCQAGSIAMSADYSKNPTENAMAVAKMLAEKYDWQGKYHLGHLPETEKSYWVFVLEVTK